MAAALAQTRATAGSDERAAMSMPAREETTWQRLLDRRARSHGCNCLMGPRIFSMLLSSSPERGLTGRPRWAARPATASAMNEENEITYYTSNHHTHIQPTIGGEAEEKGGVAAVGMETAAGQKVAQGRQTADLHLHQPLAAFKGTVMTG